MKDEKESPGGRRRRRSSISHFRSSSTTDAKSVYSSSSSGFRTPPPYSHAQTAASKSYKDLRSYLNNHSAAPPVAMKAMHPTSPSSPVSHPPRLRRHSPPRYRTIGFVFSSSCPANHHQLLPPPACITAYLRTESWNQATLVVHTLLLSIL
ncbi:hypothetical protein COP2_013367 [Malus domestica]